MRETMSEINSMLILMHDISFARYFCGILCSHGIDRDILLLQLNIVYSKIFDYNCSSFHLLIKKNLDNCIEDHFC